MKPEKDLRFNQSPALAQPSRFASTSNFIQNPYGMFNKIFYDDTDESFDVNSIDFSSLKDKIVKVVIKEKQNHFYYDKYIELLEKASQEGGT